jgi:hypothetical protein
MLDVDPTIVVETKNGYHVYYLLKEQCSTLEYLTERDKTQEKLATMCG